MKEENMHKNLRTMIYSKNILIMNTMEVMHKMLWDIATKR